MGVRLGYKLDFSYRNKAKVVEYLIFTYSFAKKIKSPSNRELGILRDYILYGYNEQTMKIILINTNINMANLRVINSNLEKKGFLRQHPTNMTNRLLVEDLLLIKDFVEKMKGDDDMCALIRFTNED